MHSFAASLSDVELTPERLIAQLTSEPLRSAYLIAGPENLRVLEAADAVRAQARTQGYSEREVFECDARDFDWDRLSASLRAPSLFATKRLLELRLPTTKPGKEGAAAIIDFCAAPAADVTLLLTGGEWSRQHGGKWSEALGKVGHIAVAWEIKPHELPDWIERRLRAKGLKADHEAVLRLTERVTGNLLAAAQEIDKLALLSDGESLDLERMESLVTDAARFDVFRLIDAALNGQSAQVSRMLNGLRAEGEAVPALMGMVVMELQRIAALARAQARGGNMAAEFKAQRIWDSKQAVYRRALQRHIVSHWERLLAEAGHIDRAAKGRAPGDPWQMLERVLLAAAETRALKLIA